MILIHFMTRFFFLFCIIGACLFHAPQAESWGVQNARSDEPATRPLPQEKYFKSIKQLTFAGINLRVHGSFDDQWLIFQHRGPGLLGEDPKCDQIYKMHPDGTAIQRISSGKGRAASPFFLPSPDRILFSSTDALQPECPQELNQPDQGHGSVWPLVQTYQIYGARPNGSDPLPLEPAAPRAYNSEATVCKDGSAVFTSDRGGDLNLYRARADRSFGTFEDIQKISEPKGYYGGTAFSPDCKSIVWVASRPREGKELTEYRDLLEKHLFRPRELEIWTSQADGSHARQVTSLGALSFAPTFLPNGKGILFSSNFRDPRKLNFNLYRIQLNGTSLEQVTFSDSSDLSDLSDSSDSFPSFSSDGKLLAFSSNRNGKSPDETNIFISEWIDHPTPNVALDEPDPANRFLAVVQELSSPPMEGRGVGTAGLTRAESWVAERFEKLQLVPFEMAFSTSKSIKNSKKNINFDQNLYKMPIELRAPQQKSKNNSDSKTNSKIDSNVNSKINLKIVASNVVGVWGNGCQKKNPIVIGAHLDHLGMGSIESLEPNQQGLHPGADDNASGVAALLEVAKIIISNEKSKLGCFVFSTFTGEEIGIVGSSRFVEHLKKLRIHPKAMLNMDMVGRLENNHLLVFGSDSANEWKPLLEKVCEPRRIICNGGGDGYGPSDHMSFYIAQVPVLHFFTGPHLDYHRTTDTAEKINATGGVQVSEIVAAVALNAASPSQGLRYKKPSSKPLMGLVTNKDKISSGAYLGTIPDYSTLSSPQGPAGGSSEGGGVPLAGTRPGSPADQAGVKAGDILKSIQGKKISTLQDFTNVLAALKPGDQVVLELLRNGKRIELPATIGKR